MADNQSYALNWKECKEVKPESSLSHDRYITKLYVYANGCVGYPDCKKSIKFDLFSYWH